MTTFPRWVLLAGLLFFLYSVEPAPAQITLGPAVGTSAASVTSLSVLVNASAGLNRGIYCWIGQRSVAIQSVVFNSTENFTLVTQNTSIGSLSFHLYRLVNPTATTANVVATLASAPTQFAMICVPMSGLDQATPNETVVNTNGTGVPISGTITSGPGDLVLGAFYSERQSAGTVTESQTLVFEMESILSNVRAMAVASTPGDGTSKTMSWSATNITTNENWRVMVVDLNSASGAVPRRASRPLILP